MKFPVIFALLTALFWGMYGPAVAQSRGAEHNPFKPYIWIGIAYLVWGILGGFVGMVFTARSYSFTTMGSVWGFAGGSLGALGALTLTLAMFSGGKPLFVMPIVFGGAVTVTAIVSVLTSGQTINAEYIWQHLWLWLGILGTAVCIVVVAYNTPHSAPHKTPPAQSELAAPAQNASID